MDCPKLWECHRDVAQDLSWREVFGAFTTARNKEPEPGPWTRGIFNEAIDHYIPVALENKRLNSSSAQQSPKHAEQTKSKHSSSQRSKDVRGTISPSFSGNAGKPSPAKPSPLSRRDGPLMSGDRDTTPRDTPRSETTRISTGNSNTPRDISRPETTRISMGNSTALVEDDSRQAAASMLEELGSHNPISAATFSQILAKFGLAKTKVGFATGKVEVLDLRHLIRIPVSERNHQDQEAGHKASEDLRPGNVDPTCAAAIRPTQRGDSGQAQEDE